MHFPPPCSDIYTSSHYEAIKFISSGACITSPLRPDLSGIKKGRTKKKRES